MNKGQKEILKAAADMFIAQVSHGISTCEPDMKDKLRVSLKEAIAASEALDEVKTKD